MFRYRLHSPDGDDLGEASYAMMIKPGEEILIGSNQRFRVVDVVPFEEEESPFVGLLKVEAARRFACRVPLASAEVTQGQGVGVSSDVPGSAAADTLGVVGFSRGPLTILRRARSV